MNPRAKAELEKSFDQLQRLMEEHPGYAGRLQMVDAPEEFSRENRLIRAGKIDPTSCRYTFEEFVKVLADLIHRYNSTPQQGHLKGISPNEAFEALRDLYDPSIQFVPEIEWLLANERYRVTVEVSGVRFQHYGQTIRVRGGKLTELHGAELWALVDRSDASMVTFMGLDFSDPFTMEVCGKPSPSESTIAPGSGVLARERSKIREHERAVRDDYNALIAEYGNPRKDLLKQVRNTGGNERVSQAVQPDNGRRLMIAPEMVESAGKMERQRDDIRNGKKEKANHRRRAHNFTESTGIALPDGTMENLTAEEAKDLAKLLTGIPNQPGKE